MGSPESDHVSPPPEAHRGSTNPDGSINLGFRNRNLPDPTRGQSIQQQHPGSDLIAYASNSQSHGNDNDSLNDDNRLPPINSFSSARQRISLSPNSFLSPSRKRSFSNTDMEPSLRDSATNPTSTNPKRLSSIKSLLNPGASDHEPNDRRSPSQFLNPPSPNYSSQAPVQDSERAKFERREMLQREAERMREALKAKERELAELGTGE